MLRISGAAGKSHQCAASSGSRARSAEAWKDIAVEGDIAGRDCMLRYRRGGRVLAAASIYRDRERLEAEVAMERDSRAG